MPYSILQNYNTIRYCYVMAYLRRCFGPNAYHLCLDQILERPWAISNDGYTKVYIRIGPALGQAITSRCVDRTAKHTWKSPNMSMGRSILRLRLSATQMKTYFMERI